MVIKTLISCQKINLSQKLKLLDDNPRYDLFYFLTNYTTWPSTEKKKEIKINQKIIKKQKKQNKTNKLKKIQ